MSGTSVLIAGVGGQGVISMGQIIGLAADATGLDVRMGQLHGMSQRGGSVESTILIGPNRSPFLPTHGADIVIALEPMELLRSVDRLHPDSKVIVSTSKITPLPLALSGAKYPDLEAVVSELRSKVGALVAVDMQTIANQNQTPRSVNMIALGILASNGWLPFSSEHLANAIAQSTNVRYRASNTLAFNAGKEIN